MTAWPIALVLIGIALAIAAIGVIARARSMARAREDGERAAQATAAGPASAAEEPPAPARKPQAPPPPAYEEPRAQLDARLQSMHQLQVLAFGTAIGPAAVASAHEETATAIRLTLASIADRPNYAPRRPMLLPKLMQAMHDDEVSRRELASIVGTDPALAGSLLRLANSPYYRIRPEPVESLDRAIALLGLEGMRSLISAALLQPVFRVSGGMFAQFAEVTWEHTLSAAAAAEAHAAVVENSDPFAAQLLALLMGLATIIVFRVATDECLARGLRPGPAMLAALIDTQAASVARHIAASWELSERIDTALADQSAGPGALASSLGRSLRVGRFIGALSLLYTRQVISEEDVQTALKTGGAHAGAYERIWSRLRANNAHAAGDAAG
ncbi:MAG: HDOD domain-containing protein [Steroidobacteraceae bacterium]